MVELEIVKYKCQNGCGTRLYKSLRCPTCYGKLEQVVTTVSVNKRPKYFSKNILDRLLIMAGVEE